MRADPGLDGLSRRGLLQAGGTLVVGFSLGGAALGAPAGPAPARTVAPDEVDGFLAIGADGRVTVYSGKVDLGTGVRTALAQLVAEELEVPFEQVAVVQGDTLLTPDQGITFGSLTIQAGGVQLRQAAATARTALLSAGADRLGLAGEAVVASRGAVRAREGGRAITYGALVGGRQLALKVDPRATLKDPEAYTVVGTPVPRVDLPDKVTGRFTYIQDFTLPGMLQARVLRPPALGATLLAVDDAAAREVPGFVATVRKGSFLAVVARGEWAAIRCLKALRATWSPWAGLPDQRTLWDHVRATPVSKVEVLQKVGDGAGPLAAPGARVLQASYDFAIHTHGSLGPSCAVADFKDGKLTCWTASQATHLLRQQLAAMLGLEPGDVRCVYVDGSGCYGRNGHEDAAADASLLARELGRPVRVQWSRADEHGWDPKGPPTLLDYRATLDAGGLPLAWDAHLFAPERPPKVAVPLVAAELAGLPHEVAHPGNIQQSLAVPYAIPHLQATAHWLASTPFRASWIRSPGRMQNTFGNESFLDECAAAAGQDPVAYRRALLGRDPRALELLARLVALSGWTPRAPGSPRGAGPVLRGRGVSFIKYELVRTYVGVVADVAVDRSTGVVTVERFHVAHDCGLVVNPDGLKNQIEGNVVQTTGRALFEELRFDRSRVTSVDWVSYPVLGFPAAPRVNIDLIDRPKEKPWGAGEPTAAVVPSAIANAIFDATGARLRSVPFTPAKVLAALG